MAKDEVEFREKIQQLGKLIAQLDTLPAKESIKESAKELVQLLMDVHGSGLERMMEIVFESGTPGTGIIDKLGQDPITGSLLLLHSLHPDDFETRVRKAVERLRPRLRKLACTVELAGIRQGAVELRLGTSVHVCRSTMKDVRSIAEDGVYEFAPDVASLEILGLDEPPATGFVTLESLVGQRSHVTASLSNAEGADHA